MAQVVQLRTASASYAIHIGRDLLRTLSARIAKAAPDRRRFLVTSPNVWELWADKVRASFPEAQAPPVLFLPPGEKHKRLVGVESLAEQLAAAGADRDAVLLAFGGGVIGDITGFLAAIYMRGIPYIQIPTTLLAQVDSSVGGKTGVNLAAGKNLLGSFHQPSAVFADVDLLRTLAPVELRAGLQESIKAAIIRSPALFRLIEKNIDSIRSGEPDFLTRIIAVSVKIKAEVVALDERESPGGPRMTLNFGHTLGHAIEAATSFKRLLHGEAVAWGSIAALRLSLARGSITSTDFARMANLIFAFGPLPRLRVTAEQLVNLSAADKKNRGGRRAFVLSTGIGSTEVVFDVTDAELHSAATAMLADMRASTNTSKLLL